jgi:hypothetical protein
MSPKRPPSRNAIAGLGLAAAGVVFRRLSGRKQTTATPPPAPAPQPEAVDDAAVAQARSELAEELARRAARGER